MRFAKISQRKLAIVILVLKCIAFSSIQADDSAAAPALDMSALASLASNLGSNPQIMSLMTNFLNPGGQKSGAAGANSAPSLPADLGSGSDLDSSGQENLSTGDSRPASAPLRRGLKPPVASQQPAAASAVATAAATPSQPVVPQAAPAAAPTPSASSAPATNPLSGLMSMLPGVLSGLTPGGSGGGGGLGALTGLLGLNKPSPSPAAAPAAAIPQSSAATSSEMATTSTSSSSTSTVSSQSSSPTTPAPAQTNTAQSILNQVLSAYAAGQIPNELIQLSLSGRVPPQIIELALSGQVPPQMIQMVITGQVPMSTINSFLGAMQQTSSSSSGTSTRANDSTTGNKTAAATPPGVFSTTRTIFEALFGMVRRAGLQPLQLQSTDGRSGVTVPTIMGPVALRMPSIPNMRSLGQLIGGSISNFSSMIPF